MTAPLFQFDQSHGAVNAAVLVRLGALDTSLARAGSAQALVSDANARRIGGGYFMCFVVPDARGCVTTRQDRLRGGC